ncbi:hypothetical protein SHKM778_71250 [Streptomyces sp. KM77-8]|uniref:FtsQ-type POTRA domain-containing protein n=1 Tax=Streptomyces haneummycinicus TaxID=3074435 RepID=A0AAT9HTA3_9ACTN
MAGSTTAERGERERERSGPPPPVRRFGRRRVRRIIASAVVLAFLGSGTFWLLYGSDLVRVERVSVSGTRELTPAQVREAADVPSGNSSSPSTPTPSRPGSPPGCPGSTRSTYPVPGRTESR